MSEQILSELEGEQEKGTDLGSANEVPFQTLKCEAVTPAAAAAENYDALPRPQWGSVRQPATKRPRTSSAPTPPPSTEWHSETARTLHETVDDAEKKVVKLELACAAFEYKMHREDKTSLNNGLHEVARRFRHLPDETTDKYKKWAVAAYTSVSEEQAEGKFTAAKAELKEAKAALEKAKVEIAVDELAPCVNAAWSNGQLRIASLSAGAVGKAQGMAELVKQVTRRLVHLGSNLVKQRHFVWQDTVAFVLASSSGVGKTFFSLAAAQPLSEALKGTVGTLYLGFNYDAPLQQKERQLLKQTPTYESVQRVLYRRLLIQLECLLAWTEEPQTGTCTPFEFDEYGLQHVVKMDAKALAALPLLANDLDAAERKALELLKAVKEAYKLSHLMLVIDEGQALDGLIKPDASFGEGGACFALRWTRELQLAAFTGNCGLLCFGLMTGIDPQTSLTDQTAGTNHELCHMPMTPVDFKKLTKDALQRAGSGKPCSVALSEALINLVAASYFPDARAVSHIRFDAQSRLSLPEYEIAHLFDEATIGKLVVGALAGIPIRNTDWARTIPSAWTKDGLRFPCPSFSMTVDLVRKDILSTFPNNLTLTINNCDEFEALAAATLQLLIWVRGEESSKKWLRRKKLMSRMFPDATVCSKMEAAFPDTIRGCFAEYPSDTKLVYYPSSNSGSHTEAFAVVADESGTFTHPLAEDFMIQAKRLDGATIPEMFNNTHEWDNTLFFRCGGSAPIDFVILHKTDKTTWQLTLADAKHTCKEKGSTVTSASQMASKGDMVFRYLEHRLKEDYEVTLTWDRTVLLLTNADCRTPVSKVPLETPRAEPVTIVRLTPSTFKMGSVTEYLFARRACVAPGGEEALQEGE